MASDLPPTIQPPDGEPDQVLTLAIDSIEPNPRQPRRHFDPAQIEALARSIRGQGIMQPVVVRPHPDIQGRFQLVAGERRWRAVTHLGWHRVPALVRQVPDDRLLETALVENIQREALTPVEEAKAYRALLDQYGYTQETLAERVGKDRSTVANMVRLLSLPPALQDDLEAGRLSIGHARALLALGTPDAQLAVRQRVLARELSVRQTEWLVNRLKPGARRKNNAAAPPADPRTEDESREDALHGIQFDAARGRMEDTLATRVIIRLDDSGGHPGPREPSGRIEIEFYSLEEFNRLFEQLTRSG